MLSKTKDNNLNLNLPIKIFFTQSKIAGWLVRRLLRVEKVRLEAKVKVNDYAHKWAGGEEDAKVIFGQLRKAGLDYIHVTEYKAWEPAFEKEEPSLVELAKKYARTIIIANGQLESPSKASKIIGHDKADLVTLGKGALANHDWVERIKQGKSIAELDKDKILRPYATVKDYEILANW
ncbi:hypothetical protein ACMX2M_07155 [Paenibacillus polymyxa]|uniref:oxidoreductase n=1 Tax=Paenibacillus sp. MABNR03 TaxID=3142626 RepID=UPI003D27E3C3